MERIVPTLKKFGRMIVIGAPEGKRDVEINLLDFYRANREILGINSVDLDFSQNAKLLEEMKPGFTSKALTPLSLASDAIFPLERADEAYKMVLMKSSGKRVCLKIHG